MGRFEDSGQGTPDAATLSNPAPTTAGLLDGRMRERKAADWTVATRMPEPPSDFPPFEVVEPRRVSLPLVFNSPHSGRRYPETFLTASRLNEQAIRRSEDSYVDELFLPAAALGGPLLRAHFPRAWLDVNREPYELDPKMFAGELPSFANTRSPRAASGLGTIPRIVSESEEIYAAPLPVAEVLMRIEAVYRPYHQTLRDLMSRTQTQFGYAILVDCHSMPSAVRGTPVRRRPDFVVGDRHGISCAAALVDAAMNCLGSAGFVVARNKPYAGGFITEHYGRPRQGFHALQIEVNRGLYMDERTLDKGSRFTVIQEMLATLAGILAAVDPSSVAEAAE
jgi:N-formylglutamate amidohydrolase